MEAAKLLGVSCSSISKWKGLYQREGPEALKAQPHPGPKPKLTHPQKQRLHQFLLQGPGKHGYAAEWWTLQRIGKLIGKHFGVTYDPSGVWHLMRSLGWSCQKPEKRARKRGEVAIGTWQHRDRRRIKTSSKKRET